jgi:hypothetical protein
MRMTRRKGIGGISEEGNSVAKGNSFILLRNRKSLLWLNHSVCMKKDREISVHQLVKCSSYKGVWALP